MKDTRRATTSVRELSSGNREILRTRMLGRVGDLEDDIRETFVKNQREEFNICKPLFTPPCPCSILDLRIIQQR